MHCNHNHEFIEEKFHIFVLCLSLLFDLIYMADKANTTMKDADFGIWYSSSVVKVPDSVTEWDGTEGEEKGVEESRGVRA